MGFRGLVTEEQGKCHDRNPHTSLLLHLDSCGSFRPVSELDLELELELVFFIVVAVVFVAVLTFSSRSNSLLVLLPTLPVPLE